MKILFQVIVSCSQYSQHVGTSWLYWILIRPYWSWTTPTNVDGLSSPPYWSHLQEVSLQMWGGRVICTRILSSEQYPAAAYCSSATETGILERLVFKVQLGSTKHDTLKLPQFTVSAIVPWKAGKECKLISSWVYSNVVCSILAHLLDLPFGCKWNSISLLGGKNNLRAI